MTMTPDEEAEIRAIHDGDCWVDGGPDGKCDVRTLLFALDATRKWADENAEELGHLHDAIDEALPAYTSPGTDEAASAVERVQYAGRDLDALRAAAREMLDCWNSTARTDADLAAAEDALAALLPSPAPMVDAPVTRQEVADALKVGAFGAEALAARLDPRRGPPVDVMPPDVRAAAARLSPAPVGWPVATCSMCGDRVRTIDRESPVGKRCRSAKAGLSACEGVFVIADSNAVPVSEPLDEVDDARDGLDALRLHYEDCLGTDEADRLAKPVAAALSKLASSHPESAEAPSDDIHSPEAPRYRAVPEPVAERLREEGRREERERRLAEKEAARCRGDLSAAWAAIDDGRPVGEFGKLADEIKRRLAEALSRATRAEAERDAATKHAKGHFDLMQQYAKVMDECAAAHDSLAWAANKLLAREWEATAIVRNVSEPEAAAEGAVRLALVPYTEQLSMWEKHEKRLKGALSAAEHKLLRAGIECCTAEKDSLRTALATVTAERDAMRADLARAEAKAEQLEEYRREAAARALAEGERAERAEAAAKEAEAKERSAYDLGWAHRSMGRAVEVDALLVANRRAKDAEAALATVTAERDAERRAVRLWQDGHVRRAEDVATEAVLATVADAVRLTVGVDWLTTDEARALRAALALAASPAEAGRKVIAEAELRGAVAMREAAGKCAWACARTHGADAHSAIRALDPATVLARSARKEGT
jgi:hypothetical protein